MKMRFRNAGFLSFGSICSTGAHYRGQGTPIKLSRTPGGTRSAPPRLNEHGEAVLRDRGFSDAEIAALAREGVLVRNRRGWRLCYRRQPCNETVAHLTGDRQFESTSLQQRVRRTSSPADCEPSSRPIRMPLQHLNDRCAVDPRLLDEAPRPRRRRRAPHRQIPIVRQPVTRPPRVPSWEALGRRPSARADRSPRAGIRNPSP